MKNSLGYAARIISALGKWLLGAPISQKCKTIVYEGEPEMKKKSKRATVRKSDKRHPNDSLTEVGMEIEKTVDEDKKEIKLRMSPPVAYFALTLLAIIVLVCIVLHGANLL